MTVDSEFAEAVDRVRRDAAQVMRRDGEFAFEVDYLLAPERLAEAGFVGPCVSRFASAEMLIDDPRPPVGRHAPNALRLDPPVGRHLRKQLQTADAEVCHAVRQAITEVVAYGYMAMIDSEGSHASSTGDTTPFTVRADRTANDIWDYWVVSFQANQDGTAAGFWRQIGYAGGDRLEAVLGEIGVLPVLGKRARLRSTGDTYATAGMVLREAQTANLLDREFTGTLRHATNRWPYEEYA